MSGILIRAMRREDVPAVCAVDRQCFVQPWSPETFEAELDTTVVYYRVAEAGGQVAGYLGSHVIQDEAHVTTFGVDPALRRRGIGERLMADFLRHAVRSDCLRITLEVRESNLAAQGLYRKFGFQPVSRRRRYYSDNDEDAVVMWIEDTTRLGFRTLLEERLTTLGMPHR